MNISVSSTGRRALATSAVAAVLLLISGPSAAFAGAEASFVPEATEAHWDGTVATVTFREADVTLETDMTTIAVTVTVDADAVCRRGDSTLRLHRSATAVDVQDHAISDEGTVDGVAEVPIRVTGLKVTGFTCVTTQVSVTAVLEDFWTGATLTHRSEHRPA
ncbi:hypothetical protein JIG36_33865 [Actinoplanes sp. LDG1-06]|uniref:Uncharacterized protein n=1 Tax=Paractinoplanes ovalisporus TaxID=2810368 RepID=A0ABS2AL70_9ACTN|nr:hypothetical protein [Actinoplanes ovalisporus]MBM2620508.1 hypothetical protein [Actinoplanes ovalisporus]